MNSPLDRVDQAQPGEFVKRVKETNKDKKQNSFSKALKEKMKEELEKKKNKQQKDMVLIVAGGVVGEFITHDENAKKLPSEVFQYLRKEIIEATVTRSLSLRGDSELSKR